MSPRKRYSFWINDVQAAGLKLVKESEDISESEQIRQALNEWLKKRGALRVRRSARGRAPASIPNANLQHSAKTSVCILPAWRDD